MEDRKSWIDCVRGLAMICVVISHCGIDNFLQPIFSYYFVPVFFFISGYLFKPNNQTMGKLKKRIIFRLGVPYVIFTILHYFVYFLVKHDTAYLTEMLIRIPTGQGLWFFSALMTVDVIVYLLAKIQQYFNVRLLIPIVGITIGLTATIFARQGEGLCWKFDIACCCLGYYYAGVLYKRFENYFYIRRMEAVILLLCYFTVSYLLYKCGLNQNVSINVYSLPIVNYLTSLVGCFVVCLFCKQYDLGKCVSYIGRNSVIIFGTNLFLLIFFKKIAERLFSDEILTRCNNIYMVIVVTCAIGIACAMSIPINRYIPFVVGNVRK